MIVTVNAVRISFIVVVDVCCSSFHDHLILRLDDFKTLEEEEGRGGLDLRSRREERERRKR